MTTKEKEYKNVNKQQTTNNKQQTTNNKQQTTNNKQQTTNNKQQTTNNKQQTGYPSIDKPWMRFYDKKWYDTKSPKVTVYKNIWLNNKEHLNDIAISYYGFKKTYKWMFEEVEQISKALLQLGIKDGDCVNMCVSYVPEAVCLTLACSKIGAVANFINPLFSAQQKIDRFNDTDSKLMIILDAMFPYMADVVKQVNSKKILIIPATNSLPFMVRKLQSLKANKNEKLTRFVKTDKRYIQWEEFMGYAKLYKGETEADYEKDKPVIMVYSSGTTGASKGIVLTNDGINAMILHYQSPDFIYERGQMFLSIVPIWLSTGNVLTMLMPLCLGVHIVLEPVFCKETFARDILKYKPNMAITATGLWKYLLECPEYSNADLSFLTYPITGGDKIDSKTETAINSFFREHGCSVPLLKGYGMCELGSTVTTSSPVHSKEKSVGYPIKGVTVAAFDMDTNKELKYRERGELRVDSPAHMKGYYKNPSATETYFYVDENGKMWGCTGDIGYVDEEGDVFICGRASDRYITSEGECVYCFDVEAVICKDELISECKVVEADNNGKKIIVAHIILSQDSQETNDSIISRMKCNCMNNLEECARPQYYKIIEAFPLHSNGKRDIEAMKKDVEGIVKL